MPAKLTKKQQQEADSEALTAAIRTISQPEVVAALKVIASQQVARAVKDAAKLLSDTIELSIDR